MKKTAFILMEAFAASLRFGQKTDKMRLNIVIIFLFSTIISSAQGEANLWYFGDHAGLDFNSGTPVPLLNGQLKTTEGCATLADTNGNLLFYTDGNTIWNKNHNIMLNGTGLMGSWSSSQSATIVPKPGSSTLFYVFTLDYEVHPNGFRYSVVDMNLKGGLGGVTSEKNILIYAPSDEKLAVVKHANGTDYWVVTHGWNSNAFYSYQLTSSGLSATPIVSNVGAIVTGSTDYVWGCMKIAPDGSKLAVARVFPYSELMDFNSNTGVVSNPIIIYNNVSAYGVEFSPNCKVLYLTVLGNGPYHIIQYDLTASNIVNSALNIYESQKILPCALQLGPNNKIYVAQRYSTKLGTINNPDVIGTGCNFQVNSVDLAGRNCDMGLPTFLTSFFNTTSISAQNSCVGDNGLFTLTSNQISGAVLWDFGDGTTSNDFNPTHQYTTAGDYTVEITATTPTGTIITRFKNITVYPQPTLASQTVNLKQCDDDLDGFSAFNLNEAIPLLTADTTGLTFTFYKTQVGAENKTDAISNVTAYTNQFVSNDVVFVRVENTNGCLKTAPIHLTVSTTLIPASFQLSYNECDDVTSGSNTDGIAAFNFSDATAKIQALYPAGQLLNISYYKNVADALAKTNAITNSSNYSNVGFPNSQNIYVRVDSQVNNECLGLGHHITLHVEQIPIVKPQTVRHCDDNQDGIYSFDTATIETTMLNGLTNVSVSYVDQNNNPLPSPLPNPFTTTIQTITATITNVAACSYTSTIQFIVDDLPEVFPIPTTLTTVCDDELNPVKQNGSYPFDTSNFQTTLLDNQTGMIVKYYDANNKPLPSPLPNPFNSSSQNIIVEVINPINTTCKATGIISLVVNPVPNITLTGSELICSDNPSFTKIINAGLINPSLAGTYTYTWYWNEKPIPTAHQYSLVVNKEGDYTVDVKNSKGCFRTRTITVNASNIATINNIEVTDLTDINSIQILVSGLGEYTYSLDNINFQSSTVFNSILPGIYTVYVRDEKGCGIATQQVNVLSIPKFFTPNDDGVNDYWNIKGTTSSVNSKSTVQIFDRYGKLIKQFNTSSQGWDGTYDGQLMPSDDYWYVVQLVDGRTAKGHFALKR